MIMIIIILLVCSVVFLGGIMLFGRAFSNAQLLLAVFVFLAVAITLAIYALRSEISPLIKTPKVVGEAVKHELQSKQWGFRLSRLGIYGFVLVALATLNATTFGVIKFAIGAFLNLPPDVYKTNSEIFTISLSALMVWLIVNTSLFRNKPE